MIAGGLNQCLRLREMRLGGGGIAFCKREAARFEMIIGQMEFHAAALRDLEDFLKVSPGAGKFLRLPKQGGAGEEAARQMMLCACFPQALHRLMQKRRRLRDILRPLGERLKQRGAAC